MPKVKIIKSIVTGVPKKIVDKEKYELVKGIRVRKDRLTNFIILNNKNEKMNE